MAFSCPALSCCLCGISVSASFDGKQHLRSLPVVNSIGYVLRFLAKLCRSLLCDDLFSHQPFPRGSSGSEETQEKKEGRMESGRLCPSFLCLQVVPGVPALPRAPGSSLAGGPQVASLPTVHPREQSGMAKTEGTSTVLTQVAVGRDHSSY